MVRTLIFILRSPLFMLALLIWNLSYLVMNVHRWSGDEGFSGWATLGFWLLLVLYGAYSLGEVRAYRKQREILLLQAEIVRLQKEALDQTVVVPILTGVEFVPAEDGSKQARIGLGPICPN